MMKTTKTTKRKWKALRSNNATEALSKKRLKTQTWLELWLIRNTAVIKFRCKIETTHVQRKYKSLEASSVPDVIRNHFCVCLYPVCSWELMRETNPKASVKNISTLVECKNKLASAKVHRNLEFFYAKRS